MSEIMLKKIPPQAIEAEIAVLGAMITKNEVIPVVAELVRKDTFYKVAHQKIYRAILELYKDGKYVDLIILIKHIGIASRCTIPALPRPFFVLANQKR